MLTKPLKKKLTISSDIFLPLLSIPIKIFLIVKLKHKIKLCYT